MNLLFARFVNALLLLAVAYVALVSMPMPLISYGTGLDASWILGLNWAHSQHLVAGRDIVFTYGPLGYLVYPDPVCGTPVLALLYRLGLYVLSLAALCRLVWIHQSKVTALWLAVLLGLEFALSTLPAQSQSVLTLTIVALLVLVDRSGWRPAEASLLAFLAAFESLSKLNQGAQAVAIFCAVLAAAVIQSRPRDARAWRPWLAVLALLPLSFAVLFWASTGSLVSLPAYLRTAWAIASGHSETMGLAGPLWQAVLAAATIAATLGAVLLATSGWRALLPGLAPAVIVAFFAFKQAMVRQDAHAVGFHLQFASGLLFLLVSAKVARDRRLILILALFSVVMGYAISVEQLPASAPAMRATAELRLAGPTLSAFLHWRTTWARMGAAGQYLRRPLRLPARFHEIIGSGTVDAEPWDVDVVQANGWRWQPRPAFQSYIAYTPMLDRMNAGHLEGPHSADFVLLNFSAIDGRHPFLETPLSWRALLDRYDLKLSDAGWLLLQHRGQSRYGPPEPLGRSVAHWDEAIRVPPGTDLLMMAPRMTPSLTGRVASMLFRSAAVYMDGIFSSGRTVRWRCVPRNLAAGFWIRPFPRSLPDLPPLFQPDAFPPSADQIVSVRFHADKPREYAPEIPIGWYGLPLAAAGKPTAN